MDKNTKGIEFDADNIVAFFKKNALTIAVVIILALIVLYSGFQQNSVASTTNPGTLYQFNYGPVIVYKNVVSEVEKHSEQIIVSSKGGAKMLSLFVLVPKALAKDSNAITIASNGKVSVLKSDPVFMVSAVNNDSISVEFSVSGADSNACSFLVVMHSATVAEMTQEQLQSAIDLIAAKEPATVDCSTANDLEKQVAVSVYNVATTK